MMKHKRYRKAWMQGMIISACIISFIFASINIGPAEDTKMLIPTGKGYKKVAVLIEPHMVVNGGTPSLPAEKIPETLKQAGIPVEVINAKQAGDSALFNTKKYAVLVIF